ncbi:HpcH/HpaI aldolase/citrate lyase family protein [Coralliovum pocilloporae]|uniref:HpcH/HpaI aldolase/citrate lyase family protein n=1 Tax=Coralliovum pocilloporae TaxID=3066369 RepID=UPI0033077E27
MRSLLFVPGDSRKKLDKALTSGADILLIDLEDSVAAANKQQGRSTTADFLAEHRDAEQRPLLYVRVNALDTALIDDDLSAVMPHGPAGIMLPKCQSGDDVEALHARLSVQEAYAGLRDGETGIMVVATETAGSVFNLGTYKDRSLRLKGMTWGGEDLSADIGAETNRDTNGHYTDPYRLARSLCLLGAVNAEAAPIDSVYTNFRDLDGLKAEAEAARRDGFTAKMAIHPAQVPVINDVFTPDDAAITHAEAVVAAFAASEQTGVVGLDGEMLDRPHLLRARRVLERARAAGMLND